MALNAAALLTHVYCLDELSKNVQRPHCERRDQSGILTGHLFGTGSNVPGIPVPDFNVDAIYRLAWDPLAKIGATAPVRLRIGGRAQYKLSSNLCDIGFCPLLRPFRRDGSRATPFRR
jgi:hypothetical protein